MSGRILNTELKEFDPSTLDGTYQNFGAVTSHPVVKVMFLNTSDVDIYVSGDGSTNKFRIPAGAAVTFDENSAKTPNKDAEYYFPRGTQLTVTQVTGAATTGSFIAHLVTRDI